MVVSARVTKKDVQGYLFAAPWFIGFFGIQVYSVFAALRYSFSEYHFIRPPIWIGLENYQYLFEDPLFFKSLYNTAYYTLIGVPLGLVVALFLAVLLNQKLRGIGIYRTIFYLPNIVPAVAASVIWLWILHPQYGLVNTLLDMVGIRGPGWLASEAWAKPALILMSLWSVGSAMLIFLAQLQSLPRQLFEAAAIEGANTWQKFARITVPLLTPTIFFNLVVGIIVSFQVFTQAYVMTQGGPVDATRFYVLYLYENAFEYFDMGYASAMALIMLVIVLVATLILNWSSKRWVHYEFK